MEFWSKGLGKRTVSLRLSDGDVVKSGDRLYVKGKTEAPVSWDYIMPLVGFDFAEFVSLLRDRSVAEYLYHSPHRWRLYRTLVFGGLRFLGLLAKQMITGRRGPAVDEPTIQVPPPSDRSRRRLKGRVPSEARARLAQSRVERPEAEPVD